KIKTGDQITFSKKVGGDSDDWRTFATLGVIVVAAIAAPYLAAAVPGITAGTPLFYGASAAISAGIQYGGMRLIDHYMPLPDPETPDGVEKSPTYSSNSWRETNPNNEGLVIPVTFGRVKVKPPVVSAKVENSSTDRVDIWSTYEDLWTYDEERQLEYKLREYGDIVNSILLRILISDNGIDNIESVLINSLDLGKNYHSLFAEFYHHYEANPGKYEPELEDTGGGWLSFSYKMKAFENLLKETSYEVLWSKGGDDAIDRNRLFFAIESEETPNPKSMTSGYYLDKPGELLHRQFNSANGFFPYIKPWLALDAEGNYDWWDYPTDPRPTMTKGFEEMTTVFTSPSFDKKIVRSKLSKELAGQTEGGVVVSPKQSTKSSDSFKFVYISLRFPRGLYAVHDEGEEAGDKKEISQRYVIDVRKKDGHWRRWANITIKGQTYKSAVKHIGPFHENKTSSEITTMLQDNLQFNKDNYLAGYLEPGKLDISSIPPISEIMDIRIRFDASTKNDQYHINDTTVDAVYSYYDYDLQTYPGCAFMDLRLGASELASGSIPKIDMIINTEYLKIKDVNSDQVLEKKANNPAWQALKLLTDDEIGLGVPFEDIVLADFVEWADFCDAEGIVSNYVIDTQASFSDQIKPIYTLGRAYPVKKSSKHSILIDKPSPVVQIFNDSNIIKDSFSITYLSAKEQANIFELEFMDENQNFEKRTIEFRHPSNEIVRENRIKYSLINCTDPVVARKHLKLMANKNMWCTKITKFSAFTDAINCELGDVINVNYRNVSWGIHSGRILRQGTTEYEFYISGTFEFEPGEVYKALVRDINTDVLHILNIENKADISGYTYDDSAQETIIKFNELPEAGSILTDAVITIGKKNNVGKLFRITEISRSGTKSNIREITAVEYFDEVYNTEDIIEEDPDDVVVEGNIPQYIDVKEIYQDTTTNKSSLFVSWTGYSLDVVVDIYFKGHKVISHNTHGESCTITIDDKLDPNSEITVTVKSNKQSKEDIKENQRTTYLYEGFPENLRQNPEFKSIEYDDNGFKLTLTKNLPNFINYSEITASYEDMVTGRRKTIYFGNYNGINDFECKTEVIPGSYQFTIKPYVNAVRDYDPIVSSVKNIFPGDTNYVYVPQVTGLRLLNGQKKWTTRDAEITWNDITSVFETKAGEDAAGAGNLSNNLSYQVDVQNSQSKIISSSSVTSNIFIYSLEQNTEDNGGKPDPQISFFVYAVNKNGIKSEEPAILDLNHVKPQVEEFKPKSFVGGVFFSWAIRYPELLKEYRYKRKVTESEETPDWSSVSNWEKMIGNVYSYTFSKEEAESKYVHFCVKAVNVYLQESELVSGYEQPEANKIEITDISDFAIDASKMFLKIPVLEHENWSGDGIDTVSWNNHQLYYSGNRFFVESGSTDKKFIYFKLPPDVELNNEETNEYNVSYKTSNSHPADMGDLGEHDFVIAVNINGHCDTAWNATANEVIGSAYIMQGAIHDAHITNLSAEKITLGPEKYWAVEEGADKTQSQLDLGADIENARVGGSTFVEGGFINSDIIQVNDKMIVGQIGKAKLDSDLETKEGAQSKADEAYRSAKNYTENWSAEGADKTREELINGAIEYAKYNGYTLIEGGYINTRFLQIDDGMIVGEISKDRLPDDLETEDGAQEKANQAYRNARDYTQRWSEEGADKTSKALINGAITDARINGVTLIQGGYIRSSFLRIDDSIIVGRIDKSKLDSSLETEIGASQKANSAYNSAKSYTENWSEEGADKTRTALINGAITDARVDGSTLIQGGYIATDFLTADNIRTGRLMSRDGKLEINLNDSSEGVKIKNGAKLVIDSGNYGFGGAISLQRNGTEIGTISSKNVGGFEAIGIDGGGDAVLDVGGFKRVDLQLLDENAGSLEAKLDKSNRYTITNTFSMMTLQDRTESRETKLTQNKISFGLEVKRNDYTDRNSKFYIYSHSLRYTKMNRGDLTTQFVLNDVGIMTFNKGYLMINAKGTIWEIKEDGIYCNYQKKISA
ncbi:MAG: hypothetical protein ACQESF_02525, partial [Nanobdellota archaeon]